MSGLPAGPFVVTLACTAAALLVMMAVTFAVALKAGKHSVVDTAWGIGIAVVATVALVSSLGYGQPARRALLAAAAVIWGLRLAVYIGSRNRGKPEDPRYRDLLSKANGDKNLYALRTVYLLQALILWVACLPIQAGMLERAPACRSPSSARSCSESVSSSSPSATGSWPGSRPIRRTAA